MTESIKCVIKKENFQISDNLVTPEKWSCILHKCVLKNIENLKKKKKKKKSGFLNPIFPTYFRNISFLQLPLLIVYVFYKTYAAGQSVHM